MTPVEGLQEAFVRLEPGELLVVALYVVVVTAVAVDLVAPTHGPRPGPRRLLSLGVTVAGSLALAPLVGGLLHGAWEVVGRAAPLRATWADRPLPAAAACFVAVDGAAWAYHWLGHHTRIGWASHRVHHLGESYDATLVLRQPWLPVHAVAVLPWVALLGFSFELTAACWTASLGYQAAQHSSRTWTLGRWEGVLVSGRAHRHHHGVGGGASNLGAVLSIWDRLGGARVGGPPPESAFGTGVREPLGPVRNQVIGWWWILRELPRPGRRQRLGQVPRHQRGAPSPDRGT